MKLLKKAISGFVATTIFITNMFTMVSAVKPDSYDVAKANIDKSSIEEINLDNAYVILSNFISYNNAAENVYIAETIPPKIIIEMYDDYRSSDRMKLINEFMQQNGIYYSNVEFYTYDLGWSLGDVNYDGSVNVRDCAYIAKKLAEGKGDSLPVNADYNRDGKKNVRDAAAISKDLASK